MITPGNETDFDAIESDMLELCRRFNVLSVGYDPWQSTQMAQRLRAERCADGRVPGEHAELQPEPIKELDAAMRARSHRA